LAGMASDGDKRNVLSSVISAITFHEWQVILPILKPCKRQGKRRKFDRIDRQNRSYMMKIFYRIHKNSDS
ncbi:hypothetical protein PO447_25115, partial [Escherichia coli]